MKKIRKLMGNFFISLLHPYSPFITLIIGGLVSSYVNLVTIPLGYILFGLGFWFIATFIYQIFSHTLNNLREELEKSKMENNSLISVIKEKDREIDRNIGLIEARYGEFSKYLKQERYGIISNKIIKKFPYVDSVQIYDYTIGVNTSSVEIKINYNTGSEYEGINMNVLKQKYYSIEKGIYLDLASIQRMYNKLKELNLDKTEEIREVFINNSFALLTKLTENNNPVNQRIFILVVEMLNNIDDNNNYGVLLEGDFDNCVRSGILGSILSNRDYMYYYSKGKFEKLGRTYFSFNDIIEGDNKIITLVINGNAMNEADKEQFINEVVEYYEEVYQAFLK